MTNPNEFFRRLTVAASRKLFGPGITDRDLPDHRPANPARDKFEAAQINTDIVDLSTALGAIKTHQGLGISDYEFRHGFHNEVINHAIAVAKQNGATQEQINKALEEGNDLGALLRQGFDDYHR